jgi:hypothetical protein
VLKREAVLLEQRARRGGQGERQDRGILVGHAGGNRRSHVGLQHGVLPEGALGGGVVIALHTDRVPENAIARLEPGDRRPYLDDLPGAIGPEDGGVLESPVQEVAGQLDPPVQGIDGNGVVPDDDLVLLRRRV